MLLLLNFVVIRAYFWVIPRPEPQHPSVVVFLDDVQTHVVRGNGDAEMEAAAKLEAKHALHDLESAAASVIKETSNHPQLVELLMRR